MRTITQEQLNERIELHKQWLDSNKTEGARLNLSNTDCSGLSFAGAILTDAILIRADLSVSDLTGANLTGADLSVSDLTGANLTGADLTGANLTGADLTGAILTRANLTGAILARAKLARADLTRAILARAYLVDADLTRAILTDAILARAILIRADLTRAILIRADLTRAYLDYFSYPLWCGTLKAKIDQRTIVQLLYHAAVPTMYNNIELNDDLRELLNSDLFKEVVNKFHRVSETGEFTGTI